ncbi:hypothetical protein B0T14DRAFT_275182 [Immersiella caudata]|uniref:Uncharacterized protein n=1 Tax=Immersiella caudata TaxID=314043 RepID=A0AA39U824_9PEZI|nr:hypothetical protein B0T14DRAFT_275182 [Immersiella caudata]
MPTSVNQILFAWKEDYQSNGLLARLPSDISSCLDPAIGGPRFLSPLNMTNIGLSLRAFDGIARKGEAADPEALMKAMIQCDLYTGGKWQGLALYLEPLEGAAFQIKGVQRRAYRRTVCDELCCVDADVRSRDPTTGRPHSWTC